MADGREGVWGDKCYRKEEKKALRTGNECIEKGDSMCNT